MFHELNKKSLFMLIIFLSLNLFSLSFSEELVWYDEFNDIALDNKKWDQPEYNRRANVAGPDGWWLKEDSYLDGQGHLIIRAKKIENRNSDNDPFDYSTGAIRTLGKFEQKFGKFEIRCQLPTQPGWWVAFWLFADGVHHEDESGRDGTEIDIFEGFGWTDKMQHALHWDGYGDMHKTTSESYTMEGIREGFHTYTLEWYENLYIFFIDGVESWRTDDGGVSQVSSYVKITAELSTESWAINSGWANDPQKAAFPDSFVVDYVRVYKLDDTFSTHPDPNDHLAFRKAATSSSRESISFQAKKAVDGNISTRWASAAGEPQWLTVDLGESFSIHKVILNWAKAYGKEYKLQVSDTADGPWSECAYITDNSSSGLITHEFAPQTGRYVQMYGLKSGDSTGFSLYEMAVYGEAAAGVESGQAYEMVQPDLPTLEQNYPNPFNAATVIHYFLPHSAPVRMTIFNLAGQKIATLADSIHQPGMHSIQWNAENQTSGLYFYQLESDDFKITKKLLVQR